MFLLTAVKSTIIIPQKADSSVAHKQKDPAADYVKIITVKH